ncbi:MAG TPA: hypothetical protein DEG17_03400 [Cyanobacteria bacterium UBA11149]|nr:hypothetical protein [Cyanobacteria bacterium UBA11367]HBE61067.1 hypothetical protein [Cyanobacteria bacterium UBA11366]HBK62270.1 hypothetical protein [Cyanobacteria bacterium UBA11166]HBR74252.1 hypothetical protein [Cyanobacteria bacterium UBA11159]HBS69852.1 hypothetical protein [Cyanobacteria bacterium UBA11153]HBW87953.1 hypothetical protein [Cyanobacteria bacterium UBA11149]HCA95015.1 hypothetical protein [Cyanobacteria bacterium UBA9226]
MIQKYWLTAILVGTTLSIPVIASSQHSLSLTLAQRPTVSRTVQNGDWQITLTNAKSLGRKVNYGGISYEAVGIWTTTTVTVRNTTSQRQSEESGRAFLYGAQFVDTQGNSHGVEHVVGDSRVSGKPYSSGESRTYTIMFDTPNRVQMSYLGLSGSYLGF